MFICIIMCTLHQPLKDSGKREKEEGEEDGGGVVLIVSHEKQCNIDALVAINKKQI